MLPNIGGKLRVVQHSGVEKFEVKWFLDWKIALEQLIAVFKSDVSRAVMSFLLVDGYNSWNELMASFV